MSLVFIENLYVCYLFVLLIFSLNFCIQTLLRKYVFRFFILTNIRCEIPNSPSRCVSEGKRQIHEPIRKTRTVITAIIQASLSENSKFDQKLDRRQNECIYVYALETLFLPFTAQPI